MIKTNWNPIYLVNGQELVPAENEPLLRAQFGERAVDEADCGTMAWKIFKAHDKSAGEPGGRLALTFDSLASHDLTYVGVIQTAKASGLKEFPLPYVMTCCHNSLCAVGGTLNEDDHRFGLSAAKKYGGIFVPAHVSVIHSYMREEYAGCGRMILGSDSHTRYGALGTMGVGEGGGELVKQLLGKTYDIAYPEIICVKLTGKPKPGVGPQDVALALIRELFPDGLVKNKVLEFVGDGIGQLSADYRCGIDVMTTEMACLSSIWMTDDVIREYYKTHGRPEDFSYMAPETLARYDGSVTVELDKIEPMIALPFHPSHAFSIREFYETPEDILRETERMACERIGETGKNLRLVEKMENGRLRVDQGVVAGCAGGTFENIASVSAALRGHTAGNGGFSLSVYPASQPVYLEVVRQGLMTELMKSGVIVRSSFCGPCFGAGEVPANGGLSVRHVTRNFPNREGSKPGQGQAAAVALMDARSIAATAKNGGLLTAAGEETPIAGTIYYFDRSPYDARVYNGFRKAEKEAALQYGPNITDWPEMKEMPKHLLLGTASVITDPVTTTDELIPSGDASTYRSNPRAMAEFTLSRKDPAYVGRAKEWQRAEESRAAGKTEEIPEDIKAAMETAGTLCGGEIEAIGLGSLICAVSPGDGSAREQAASCQRVLGGCANIAAGYATKRYRSNLINWGMLPLRETEAGAISVGDAIFLPDIRTAVAEHAREIHGYMIQNGTAREISFLLDPMTEEETGILLAGGLINYYHGGMQ